MSATVPPSRLRGGVLLGIGQVVGRGAVAIYLLILVRELDRSDYGDLAYALAVVNIAVTVADGGLSRLLLRDVARSSGDRAWLIGELVLLRAAWTAILLVVLLAVTAAGVWAPGDLSADEGIALLMALLALEAAAGGVEAAAVGAERHVQVATGQALSAAVLFAFLPVVAVGPVTPELAVAGLGLAAAARLAWHAARWGRQVAWTARLPPHDRLRAWVAQGAPFLVLSVLGAIYYRIDMVILHARRGADEVAGYAAAYRLIDAVVILGGVASAAIVPHLSRLHRDDTAAVWPLWRRYCALTVAVAAPAAVALALVAQPVAALLFGERYRDSAGDALRWLAVGIPFMLLQVVNASVLFSSDVQRLLVRLSFVHVAVNIALTWWLSGRYGSVGAAAATSISELFAFAYFGMVVWWLFRRGSLVKSP